MGLFNKGLGGGVDKTKPVEAPEGYKWAVSKSWISDVLYELHLIPRDHFLNALGMPTKGGKVSHKHVFGPHEYIRKETEVRKKSQMMVKEYYAEAAEKQREADALRRARERIEE